MRRRLLLAVAAAALAGAGCSDAHPHRDEGTARDPAARFAACMRDNGVSAFPDPDASGELTIDGVLNGSSIDPDSPAWKAATAACRDLQPAGFTGDDDVTPEQQDARLQFAQCMRDNGVEDFPDPAKGDALVDTRRIPSAAGDGIAAVDAAMRICGDLAEAAGAARP